MEDAPARMGGWWCRSTAGFPESEVGHICGGTAVSMHENDGFRVGGSLSWRCRVAVVSPVGRVDNHAVDKENAGGIAMALDMKLDTDLVRKLREDKGWSQEHLAAVSGLSARTVQRLEAEGNASLESRSALAAAGSMRAEAVVPVSRQRRPDRGRMRGNGRWR